jgi:hypothetical protein
MKKLELQITTVTILIVMREIAAGLYAQRYDSQFI